MIYGFWISVVYFSLIYMIDNDNVLLFQSESRSKKSSHHSEEGGGNPKCQGCHKQRAQFVCAGCGNQWYCSRECQVSASVYYVFLLLVRNFLYVLDLICFAGHFFFLFLFLYQFWENVFRFIAENFAAFNLHIFNGSIVGDSDPLWKLSIDTGIL